MSKVYRLEYVDLHSRAEVVASELRKQFPGRRHLTCFPVPRGGVPAAYVLKIVTAGNTPKITLHENPHQADFILDDIIDSGDTLRHYDDICPSTPFYALVNKQQQSKYRDAWVIFPWEHQNVLGDMTVTITRLLQQIGEDPKRGGLLETPSRVAKAWQHWSSGYGVDPSTVLKEFEDGGETYDEMIVVKDIPFYSHCEHHLAPFFGTANIGYIPNGKIVGLSKLSRLLDVFANRLQVQERLTAQVADALMDSLQPRGAAVSIRARHLCMESRGIKRQGSETVTNVLRGVFRDDAAARAEFLGLSRP